MSKVQWLPGEAIAGILKESFPFKNLPGTVNYCGLHLLNVSEPSIDCLLKVDLDKGVKITATFRTLDRLSGYLSVYNRDSILVDHSVSWGPAPMKEVKDAAQCAAWILTKIENLNGE